MAWILYLDNEPDICDYEVGILSVDSQHTRSEYKVRELAIVCLPWQHWTETSVWFDDVGIPSLLFASTEKVA
jgi:hypothetical protein